MSMDRLNLETDEIQALLSRASRDIEEVGERLSAIRQAMGNDARFALYLMTNFRLKKLSPNASVAGFNVIKLIARVGFYRGWGRAEGSAGGERADPRVSGKRSA